MSAADARVINKVFAENEFCAAKVDSLTDLVDAYDSLVYVQSSQLDLSKRTIGLHMAANENLRQQIEVKDDEIISHKKAIKRQKVRGVVSALGVGGGSAAVAVGVTALVFLLK